MPPKKRAPKGMGKPLPPGQILTDLRKKEWKLGPLVGQGGFGYLYLGSDKTSSAVSGDAQYVIKVEPHSNGPLFVELAFYQRAAKSETISSWIKSKKLAHLGVPKYIGSGSFENNGTKFRFLIMDRFGQDVEKILLASDRKFSLCTAFSLGLRIIEVLEYLHEQEYVHADIKASNLMTGFGKKNENLVYLLDYGLAYRYCPSGQHVVYKEDPKRKHDGTIEYTSRDAHKGLAPARRGDLEILAYCMLQWICGHLPWENKLTDPNYVMAEKSRFMNNISTSLRSCFAQSTVPEQLEAFFKYILKLEYTEKPDYNIIKQWFKDGLKKNGAADDGKSVIFTSPAPKKKGKAATNDKQLVNGDKKRGRKFAIDESADEEEEEPGPTRGAKGVAPRPRSLSNEPSKKIPTRRSPRRKAASATEKDQAKRKATGARKRACPAKSPSRIRVFPVKSPPKAAARGTKAPAARKRASPVKSPPTETKQQQKRRVQRNRKARTVDFAQSP